MKKVLVTGASKGIGRAIAMRFAREGYAVAINYNTDTSAAQSVLAECNALSEGNTITQADISQESHVSDMFSELKTAGFTELDVLVNNAGIINPPDTYRNIEGIETLVRGNLIGPMMVTKYATEIMTRGKIVNITSIHGRIGHGNPGVITYSASKAALDSYTKNLAKELAPNILVNAVAPGRVATPMWDIKDDKEKKSLGEAHAIERMIEPEEIADAVNFLVNNDAMCGEILTIDGGMSLKTLG